MKTPVAFLIFKRPDTTEKVFEAIRQVKPTKLLVVADGPRTDQPGEAEKCTAARAIVERVDWDCEVLKNYSDINLGCGLRPATGITWVFEQVEEAIILEDDCVPHPTFFRFCKELLEKYRDDQRIMHISGNNFQFGNKRSEYSYYFSRYTHSWGWATWRRAWQYYDFKMKHLPQILEEGWLNKLLQDRKAIQYWNRIFQEAYEAEQTHIWDYQWNFACFIRSGLSVISNVNLVSNIGFNTEATHTLDSLSPCASVPAEVMCFPLSHPPFVICDTQADNFDLKNQLNPGLLSRFQRKAKKIFIK